MDIVKLYQEGMSSCKISKLLNIRTDQVFKALKQAGVASRSNKENSRKYECNYSYFKIIDTEDKAYWLGFILADGYISCSRNETKLGITLHVKDIAHLEKFQKAIESTYPIKTYKGVTSYGPVEYCRLVMASQELISDIKSHGVTEHKSLTLKFPKTVPDHLAPHLIRGYFDGDGSWAKDKKSKIGFNCKLCGTKEFLLSVGTHFGLENMKLYKRWKDDKNNYYLSLSSCHQVLKIMNYLYKDSTIYLDRKYERYLLSLQVEIPERKF